LILASRAGGAAFFQLIRKVDFVSDENRWTRRGFFSARSLGSLSGGLLSAVLPDQTEPEVDENQLASYWSFSRRAMGCDFSVFLPPTRLDALVVADAALEEIETLEELLTVYSGSSAMSYVNQNAAGGPVRVDHRMFELLARSAKLTEQTDGAFDVSAGALIKAWGFLGGPQRVPSDAERESALARTGMAHVRLDEEERTVQYDFAGLEINLGSIGKGYAIDRAVRRMREDHDVTSALVQGGMSSIYGVGAPTADPRGWLVGIEDPADVSRVVATIRLNDKAMGTAGSAYRFFEADGRRYGHVLDPRTGRPAETNLASASVIATDSATADALATALYVLGLDKARDFCKDHPSIAAILVGPAPAGRGVGPRIVTCNLSKQDVNLQPGLAERANAIHLQTGQNPP
jgi:thiamine biosynthesis lipoprotein